jgi:NADP-dependent 3-hydroxy acid dehydrogenase YdfG
VPQDSPHDKLLNRISQGGFHATIPADAIARAIAFAIEQPDDVDVSEIIARPTASA